MAAGFGLGVEGVLKMRMQEKIQELVSRLRALDLLTTDVDPTEWCDAADEAMHDAADLLESFLETTKDYDKSLRLASSLGRPTTAGRLRYQ
jgi:hypothetical protein